MYAVELLSGPSLAFKGYYAVQVCFFTKVGQKQHYKIGVQHVKKLPVALANFDNAANVHPQEVSAARTYFLQFHWHSHSQSLAN